ncbi:MAG: radical SAM protein [Clostridiales bacterium]
MIKELETKSILTINKHPSSWFGVKYNMNIYRGCQHNCIYCDSRSECYRIENFNDIIVKINAIDLLKKELKRKRNRTTIGTGSMCDAYMPIEKEYKLVRKALKIIVENKFPFHVTTKSNLILRDVDLFQEINKIFTSIAFTITTTNTSLSKKIEPNAPSSIDRFKSMGVLSSLNILTGVTMMPILPFIEDTEENIYKIVEMTSFYGGKFIYPCFGMTLRDRQRTYYYEKLDKYFPGIKEKYKKKYKNKYGCSASNIKKLKSIFYETCDKFNISTTFPTYEQKISSYQLSIFEDI